MPSGEKRRRDTHESKTDKDAYLFKKSKGKESKLAYLGHILMENRHGLVVNAKVTQGFVEDMREMQVTPHVAQNGTRRSSAIDGRTTRHSGYRSSQTIRKRIEECFGWAKTIGGLRKNRFIESCRAPKENPVIFRSFRLMDNPYQRFSTAC